MRNRLRPLFLAFFLMRLFAFSQFYALAANPKPAKMLEHKVQEIEGWQVFVDTELTDGAGVQVGTIALPLLGAKLAEIKLRLPASRIEKLQQVAIYLDHMHELTSMQYHPGAGWLADHGYDEAMVKCVHIPRAQRFINHVKHHQQPWALMHELAHAYHDQVLSWEHAGIKNTFDKFVREHGQEYETVLHINGHETKHYALTNEKEFFAEMTESLVGTNDFYPFVRGELRVALPEVHALMKAIWFED